MFNKVSTPCLIKFAWRGKKQEIDGSALNGANGVEAGWHNCGCIRGIKHISPTMELMHGMLFAVS